jgi:hypothetical protein
MTNVANDKDGISGELAAGIEAYDARIAPLLGRIVTIRTPDGQSHTGTLGEAAKCQPIVTQQDGKRFLIPHQELDRLVASEPKHLLP